VRGDIASDATPWSRWSFPRIRRTCRSCVPCSAALQCYPNIPQLRRQVTTRRAAMRCPQCEYANSVDAKFCNQCATPLTELASMAPRTPNVGYRLRHISRPRCRRCWGCSSATGGSRIARSSGPLALMRRCWRRYGTSLPSDTWLATRLGKGWSGLVLANLMCHPLRHRFTHLLLPLPRWRQSAQ
jgi:hypothetical protein